MKNKKNKDKDIEEYKVHVRHYCCLYHFTQGKTSKSSTPCYNHIHLGIINPIHSTLARSPKLPDTTLTIQAKPHDVQFHTHYLNQIDHKQSLPKRLYYPRVYVEQIFSKKIHHNWNKNMIKESFIGDKSFQEIFLLFKWYAKLTMFKNQGEVVKSVRDFCRKNGIDLKEIQQENKYFFKENQFVDYLIQYGFQTKLASEFWQAAFNKNRFKSNTEKKDQLQVVSMRAFAYNYKKFYLQELQSYKNCLSEPALRQRMIDLRLFLEPWFTKNIIFKENHQHWKQVELSICSQLQRYKEDELYFLLLTCIDVRNKIWLFMRVLAKILYQSTDQKNIGLVVFNQKATAVIVKNRDNLQTFSELLDKYQSHLLENNRSKQDKILITDLFQFGRLHFPAHQSSIICYLRGLYKYLYFFKRAPYLHLNHLSLNLDCHQIGQTTYNQLLEFLSYKQESTDHFMEMVENICEEVNETVDSRAQILGHKSFLNECNYLAQATLKMIKRLDFVIFYKLEKVRQLYKNGEISDLKKLRNILNEEESKDDNNMKEKFWKRTFQFIQQERKEELTQKQNSQNNQFYSKNYQYALDMYQDLKKKLQGKIPTFSLNAQGNHHKSMNIKEKDVKRQKKSRKNKRENGESNQNNIDLQQKSQTELHKCYLSTFCSICDEICSTNVNDSLSQVDNMSNYLMDLLNNKNI